MSEGANTAKIVMLHPSIGLRTINSTAFRDLRNTYYAKMFSPEDAEKLKEYIDLKGKQCHRMKLSSNVSSESSGKFCDYFFDGILCWPPTKAGITAQMRCPYDFVKSVNNEVKRIVCINVSIYFFL